MADYCSTGGCSNGRYFDYDYCLRHLEEIYGRGALLAPIPESGAGRAMVPGLSNEISTSVRPPKVASSEPHRDDEKTPPTSNTVTTPEGDEGDGAREKLRKKAEARKRELEEALAFEERLALLHPPGAKNSPALKEAEKAKFEAQEALKEAEKAKFEAQEAPPPESSFEFPRPPDTDSVIPMTPRGGSVASESKPSTSDQSRDDMAQQSPAWESSSSWGHTDSWDAYREARSGDRSGRWLMLFFIQLVVLSMMSLLDFSPPSQWALMLLGIHLVAVSCTTTAIFWTEHFDRKPDNGIRKGFGSDAPWLGLNLIAIAIWAILLAGLNLDQLQLPPESVLNELFDPQTVGYPISFSILGPGTEPIYWALLSSHVLFLMSSIVRGLHVGRPRTHWTASLGLSLSTLLASSLGIVPDSVLPLLASLISLIVLSGSCCWLYARNIRNSELTIPLVIVMTIAVSMQLVGGPDPSPLEYQAFLLSPAFVLLVFLSARWSSDPASPQSKLIRISGFAALSAVAAIQLGPDFTREQDSNLALAGAALVIVLSAVSVRGEHFRSVQQRRHRILAILERRSTDREIREFVASIPIFGTSKSGKSTFLTALWTIVTEPLARDVWWGVPGYLESAVEADTADELGDLSNKGENTDRDNAAIEHMVSQRSSAVTYHRNRVDEGSDAEAGKSPKLLPAASTPFPFVARAAPAEAEAELNAFKTRVNSPNVEHRKHLKGTIDVKQFTLQLKFSARIRTESDDFFGFSHSPPPCDSTVRVKIGTFDHPGETFKDAVGLIRALIGDGLLNDFVAGRSLPPHAMERFNDLDSRRPGTSKSATSAAERIITAESIVYIVDADVLTDSKSADHGEVRGDSENFLAMLCELREDGHDNLKALQICLNKADELLKRGEDQQIRIGGQHIPRDWADLNEKAEDDKPAPSSFELLDRITNQHLKTLEIDDVEVKSRFLSNLGGVTSKKETGKSAGEGDDNADTDADGDGIDDEDSIDTTRKVVTTPPYPMLPVNVMESVIDVLLSTNLRSVGE